MYLFVEAIFENAIQPPKTKQFLKHYFFNCLSTPLADDIGKQSYIFVYTVI